jgi:hypothetical protein
MRVDVDLDFDFLTNRRYLSISSSVVLRVRNVNVGCFENGREERSREGKGVERRNRTNR